MDLSARKKRERRLNEFARRGEIRGLERKIRALEEELSFIKKLLKKEGIWQGVKEQLKKERDVK